MPIFIVGIIVQVLFGIHAVKTGRDTKWLYFIILFPLVGCIVYFIAEILPELLGGQSGRKVRKSIVKTIDPNRDIRTSADKLSISSNVDNVVAFAQECVDKKLFSEAIKTYKEALKGIFESDPKLLLGLAEAYFENGDYREVTSTLDCLIELNPDFKSTDGHLLYACALQELQEYDKAKEEYEALIIYYPGPEAKCRYGLMLKKLGEADRAKKLFEDIQITARHSPHHYYKMHKEWIELAKREIE